MHCSVTPYHGHGRAGKPWHAIVPLKISGVSARIVTAVVTATVLSSMSVHGGMTTDDIMKQ